MFNIQYNDYRIYGDYIFNFNCVGNCDSGNVIFVKIYRFF